MKTRSGQKETSKRASFSSSSAALPFPVEMVPLTKLRPADRNARTHSKKQIQQIAASMKRFGVTNPIIADGHDKIVAGHGRLEAARLLGLKVFPVIRLTDLSDAEVRAYMLADNKLAQNAGWDREVLAFFCDNFESGCLPSPVRRCSDTGANNHCFYLDDQWASSPWFLWVALIPRS